MNNDRLTFNGRCTDFYAPPLSKRSSFSGSKFDIYCAGITIAYLILQMCGIAGKEAAFGRIWPKMMAIKELAGVEQSDDQSDDETTERIFLRLDADQQNTLMKGRLDLVKEAVKLMPDDRFVELLGDLVSGMLAVQEEDRLSAATASATIREQLCDLVDPKLASPSSSH